MKNKHINKGSEWRKWDLQIHAPGSEHADQYKAQKNSDPWDEFLDFLKKSDVSVFGITDYFSICGYEKLLEKIKDQGFGDKIFFPNIELRLDINTNKENEEIHIHLIFDNKYETKKINDFLSSLETTSTKKDGTNYYCTPADLKEVGYGKVSISLTKLKETLNKKFGNTKPYLVVGAYKGQGGFVYGNKRGISERKKVLSDEVDKFCDFVFATQKDKEWFLKSDRYEGKSIKSHPKPVLATSDCHSFEDCRKNLGQPSKMTWIKADTTFKGLQQVIIEPESRCFIGEKPEKLKMIKSKATKFISKVKIEKKT